MDTEIKQLTTRAVPQLLSGDAENQDIVVQVFNISKTKTGRLMCNISDGKFYLKAFLNDQGLIKPVQDQNTIISIMGHGALKTSIGIAKLKVIGSYKEKIGMPDDWSKAKENGASTDNENTPKKFILETDKLTRTDTEKKSVIKKEQIKNSQVKSDQYEKIDDLYIGLKRFTLLCRIVRKTLKESPKKGTKILEIQLVDKSKKKIMGTFFGDCAPEFDDYLKEGSVYEIAKGYIRQGNYNNSRNQMLSPYTLIFDARSTFSQVPDFNIIVRNEDTAITLGEVYQRHIFHQEYDIVAYVYQIKDEVSVQRNDKNFSIREIMVADPDAQITMAVKLWRWNQAIDMDMIGKVVIFSRFALKQSKDSTYLSSSLNSTILTNHEHPMKQYERKNIDIESFKATTVNQLKSTIDQNSADVCHSIKELDRKVQYMDDSETIISILNVWVSRFAFQRKWCYEACPKCNKGAEKYNKCPGCDYGVEETNLRFVLGTEIADFCGSIWVTAYDELAKKIFYDLGSSAASTLLQLDKEQLSQVNEKYAFQFFTLKIITKKDREGRVKHVAGRLYECAQQKIASQNLKTIQQIMNQ